MDDAVGGDGVTVGIGQDRKAQTEPVDELTVVLDVVDGDRDQLGSRISNLGDTRLQTLQL